MRELDWKTSIVDRLTIDEMSNAHANYRA